MDVDKIQKVNKLANELLAHGMAKDREEAAKMAEEKLRNKDMTDIKGRMEDSAYTKNVERKEEDKKDEIKEESTEENTKINEQNDQLISEIKKDVEEHKEKVSMLVGKMNEMIKKINELEEQVKSPIKPKSQEKETQTEFKKPEPTKEEKGAKPETRYGQYKPEDVAIDKIFYYGNKRQE